MSDPSATLMNAIHLLHEHGEIPFHERLFSAASLLFPNTEMAFSQWGKVDDAQQGTINLDFYSEEAPLSVSSGLLILIKHPYFQNVTGRGLGLMSLQNFVAKRERPATRISQIAFWPVEVRHPVLIPLLAEIHLSALTLNCQGSLSFTSEDMWFAAQFARFAAQANHVSEVLVQARPQRSVAEVMDQTPHPLARLSRREVEVLHRMSQGKRDKEIAIILGISYRTVTHHVSAILQKLGVETRTAAVAVVSASVVASTVDQAS